MSNTQLQYVSELFDFFSCTLVPKFYFEDVASHSVVTSAMAKVYLGL